MRDHCQLPEIGASGAFAALAERLGAVELTANRRQGQAWERAALAELRSGNVGAAVAALADHDRIHVHPDAEGTRQALVDAWWQGRRDGAPAPMYAQARSDVAELNRRARAVLRANHRLGDTEVEVGGRCFAVGDEVVCLRNNRRLGLVNGTQGSVTALGPDGLTMATSAGTLEVPSAYLEAGRLDHAYALTIHKAQGHTVDRALVLGSDALYREAGYTALSRARQRVDLFIAGPLDAAPDDAHLASSHRPTPPTPTDNTQALAALAGDLGVSRAQRLALHHAVGTDTDDVAAHPPAVIVAALGPPPPRGTDRDVWEGAARSALAYRAAHHVTDPVVLLGGPAASARQAMEREQARRDLAAARRHLGLGELGLTHAPPTLEIDR